MADFFEPSPKTPERKTNNSNPPNIKEERNRKRKASVTAEEYHETNYYNTQFARKVADQVAAKLLPLFDSLDNKIDQLGMQIGK
jgi:hypothetical protein